MKLHLPLTLLTTVLAAFIALPAQAVEAPEGYTTTYLNSPGTLENYSSLTAEDYMAFILQSSQEITPTGADYWTSSTPLVSGGNVFFGSYNSDSPVALSFKDGNGSAFYDQSALTFDTLSNLTFSTITDNEAAISVENGTLTITNVNDGQSDTVDVLFKDIKNTSYSGGAILASTVTISHNGNVSFSGNSSYSYYDDSHGGAIYASTVTISNNGDVSFSGNSSSSSSSYYFSCGGAIYAKHDVTISRNGNVSFSDNSADGYGGAIVADADNGDVTISNNGDVSFSGNSASAASSSSCGGAIYATTVTISNNSDVSFSGNSSSSSSYDSYGGAIEASTVTISNNADVSFSGNSASADDYSYGGAIDAYTVTINNNADVSFSGNSASADDESYGGAIYAYSGLTIQGNDSVLFEKNYENNNGAYRLRSIYSDGGMTLSAKTGGNITFYDSVYTAGDTTFNSDYTDAEGNTQSAKGAVIFSGKYAEQHLNEILDDNNENRTATAEEILSSQTSEIRGDVYVDGGSVQIVDGAVLKVGGDTVSIAAGSEATLAISDAELVAENATIEVGASATLQLSKGATVTADEINIKAGATLALGDVAMTTSAIDSMVAAYRISSLNVIDADLTFAAGSTIVTDGTGFTMGDSVLTFNATSDGKKINLVFTLGAEYSEDEQVVLFSNVDIVKFLMDGEEVDTSSPILASEFFAGAGINENTTLHYDSTANVVYLQGVSKVVPEPATATLSLLALAALAARRRRK